MKLFHCTVIWFLFMMTIHAEEYVHVMRMGKTEYRVTTRIIHDGVTGTIRVEKNDPLTDKAHSFLLDAQGGTVLWSIEENGSEVLFDRDGSQIIVINPKRPEAGPEPIEIDGKPWFATMPEGLRSFVETRNEKMEFWTINPESCKAYLMMAKRTKTETITIQGVEEHAVKIRVTASGVPALFFSMSFWFRETDAVFLKYEGKAGGPGSADVTTELLR